MENVKLEIFKVFAKLGIFAFGGPAAHVAIMTFFVQSRPADPA